MKNKRLILKTHKIIARDRNWIDITKCIGPIGAFCKNLIINVAFYAVYAVVDAVVVKNIEVRELILSGFTCQ